MGLRELTVWDLVTFLRDRVLVDESLFANAAPPRSERRDSDGVLQSPELGTVYAFVLGVCSSLVASVLYSIGSAAARRIARVNRGEDNPLELREIKLLQRELREMKKMLRDQRQRKMLIQKLQTEYAEHAVIVGRREEEVRRLLGVILDSCSRALDDAAFPM